ncbi:MAG TPA: hypothetical protein VFW44_21810 [Bryobacteraceae bacterium]|nr:hypothetical protein [Bryobacteraceae bacterium]
MFYKVGCSLLLAASLGLAQQVLLPGTVASAAAPDGGPTTAPSFDPSSTSSSATHPEVTGRQRVQWALDSTLGPASLTAGLFSAGWGTLFDHPKTYGPHWEGFGDRYGMRLSGLALSNTMEAGLGAIWGEDPRYKRVGDEAPFFHRLGHAAEMTFMSQSRDGGIMPAYARFVAISGSNVISNSWRASGENDGSSAAIRIGLGFFGRFGSNTFDEFWPDVRHKVFHRD